MLLFSGKYARKKNVNTFEMIDLDQFKHYSFQTVVGYIYLYIRIVIILAFYASDVYTAVQLLGFDKWASIITPAIPYRITRWLFAACIIVTAVLTIYKIVLAIRIYRTRNVSLNYTTPFAKMAYSVKSFRYYCVFCRISDGRSFQDKVCFFVYFSFKDVLILLLGNSPRQAINGMTLFAALELDGDFLGAVKQIALENKQEAVVVSFMAFAFIVWAFTIIRLAIATILYPFVFCCIGEEADSLEEYCCIRVDERINYLAKKYHFSQLDEMRLDSIVSEQPIMPKFDFPMDVEDGSGDSKSDFFVMAKSESRENLRGPEESIYSREYAHDNSMADLNAAHTSVLAKDGVSVNNQPIYIRKHQDEPLVDEKVEESGGSSRYVPGMMQYPETAAFGVPLGRLPSYSSAAPPSYHTYTAIGSSSDINRPTRTDTSLGRSTETLMSNSVYAGLTNDEDSWGGNSQHTSDGRYREPRNPRSRGLTDFRE